jgi:hypothetical protein
MELIKQKGTIQLLEGGDARLPTQPRGFTVYLGPNGMSKLFAFSSIVTQLTPRSFVISEDTPEEPRKAVGTSKTSASALRKSYSAALRVAEEYSRALNLPIEQSLVTDIKELGIRTKLRK